MDWRQIVFLFAGLGWLLFGSLWIRLIKPLVSLDERDDDISLYLKRYKQFVTVFMFLLSTYSIYKYLFTGEFVNWSSLMILSWMIPMFAWGFFTPRMYTIFSHALMGLFIYGAFFVFIAQITVAHNTEIQNFGSMPDMFIAFMALIFPFEIGNKANLIYRLILKKEEKEKPT